MHERPQEPDIDGRQHADATVEQEPVEGEPVLSSGGARLAPALPAGGAGLPGESLEGMLERLQELLRRLPAEASRLQRERSAAELAGRLLDTEVRAAEQRIPRYADDRGLPEALGPTLGKAFLASLERVHVSRHLVASTCAHVACGRIHEVPGAALHELRAGKGPTAPQRQREGLLDLITERFAFSSSSRN